MINIPERLKNKLDPDVLAIINPNDANKEMCFCFYFQNSPHYFPEYTIHGEGHINSVFKIADKLIPNEVLDKLDNIAVDVLVLGIILHDLGMFIKEDGFKKLLSLNPWKKEWEKYILDLKRADGEALKRIFGSDEKKYRFEESSIPCCGEFIRKHHHELAQYIAVNGMPGEKNRNLLKSIDSTIVNCAGLIAKSHGMSLREMESEIEKLDKADKIPELPVYYLMSVLRLADLLDADGRRAPKILADLNSFESEYSKGEWRANQGIKATIWNPKQFPETVQVRMNRSEINNSEKYLKLKGWFEYWQKELDTCWAVIGEKHGEDYKLSVRRITSHLFDKDFRDDLQFVTRDISLRVNPEIVKLLIAPLYGDNPSYGVRELIQNAVDACNERKVLDGTEGEITVSVDTKKRIFSITDNGIGMTEDVIANYYLNVGASYRMSSAWKEKFTDENGKSIVARSGRFGIGALAAFLLGEKIAVKTRNVNDEIGYKFSYSIEPAMLNVEKAEGLEVGTTVEIEMNDNAVEMVKENNKWKYWYCLTKPKIKYIVDEVEVKLTKKLLDFENDEVEWKKFNHKEYGLIRWKLNPSTLFGTFICNGIMIEDSGFFADISITDKDSFVPTNIARNRIDKSFWESEKIEALVEEIWKYYIAYVFCTKGYFFVFTDLDLLNRIYVSYKVAASRMCGDILVNILSNLRIPDGALLSIKEFPYAFEQLKPYIDDIERRRKNGERI